MKEEAAHHLSEANDILDVMKWDTRDFSREELATMQWLIDQAKILHGVNDEGDI